MAIVRAVFDKTDYLITDMQGVEATVFGLLMSLHVASSMTGKVLGSVLTSAFGVTSSNFTNLAPLILVSRVAQLHCCQSESSQHCPLAAVAGSLHKPPHAEHLQGESLFS